MAWNEAPAVDKHGDPNSVRPKLCRKYREDGEAPKKPSKDVITSRPAKFLTSEVGTIKIT